MLTLLLAATMSKGLYFEFSLNIETSNAFSVSPMLAWCGLLTSDHTLLFANICTLMMALFRPKGCPPPASFSQQSDFVPKE